MQKWTTERFNKHIQWSYQSRKEGIRMFKYDQGKTGAYIGRLIDKDKKYKSRRQFCIAYLKEVNEELDEDRIGKMGNRVSQIINGKKSIQVYDLPIFSKLLDVSCEQILSCGKCYKPIKSHITNYEVAFSKNRKVWEEYMNREDKLFLNYDEYGKSVVDYALEIKNYEFIKYLMENDFLRFVDNSKWRRGFTFGLTTSIDRRTIEYTDIWPIAIDMSVPEAVYYEEHLRTQAIALATEYEDFEELDRLKARENPAIHNLNIFGNSNNDAMIYQRNIDLIESVANSDKKIIEYYSDEYVVEDVHKRKNTFIFPYLGEVIDIMIQEKSPYLEIVLQKAIEHNSKIYKELEKMIKAYSKTLFEEANGNNTFPEGVKMNQEWAERTAKWGFKYVPESRIVSYNYMPENKEMDGIVSNIIQVKGVSKVVSIKKLVDELNDWANKVIELGKER